MPSHGRRPALPSDFLMSILLRPPPDLARWTLKDIVGPAATPPRRKSKVVAVMPAYNAERTLPTTIADIPAGSVDSIILVDDGSKDRTVELARELGLTVIVHPQNRGYGGNQKTCYRHALDAGAD